MSAIAVLVDALSEDDVRVETLSVAVLVETLSEVVVPIETLSEVTVLFDTRSVVTLGVILTFLVDVIVGNGLILCFITELLLTFATRN